MQYLLNTYIFFMICSNVLRRISRYLNEFRFSNLMINSAMSICESSNDKCNVNDYFCAVLVFEIHVLSLVEKCRTGKKCLDLNVTFQIYSPKLSYPTSQLKSTMCIRLSILICVWNHSNILIKVWKVERHISISILIIQIIIAIIYNNLPN